MKGFTITGNKVKSIDEYYKRKYPNLYFTTEDVMKLLNNKNFRNNQNYLIQINNSFEKLNFNGKFIIANNIKSINNIKYFKSNSIFGNFFNLIYKRKNIVFFLGIGNNFNKYLVIKSKYLGYNTKK